jgi:TonB family protein
MLLKWITVLFFMAPFSWAQTATPVSTSSPTPPKKIYLIDPATGNKVVVTKLPKFLVMGKPAYPLEARRANIEGEVVLRVDITATGDLKNIEVAKGIGHGCDEAAMAALRHSKMSPAYVGDKAVSVRVQIPFMFKIEH